MKRPAQLSEADLLLEDPAMAFGTRTLRVNSLCPGALKVGTSLRVAGNENAEGIRLSGRVIAKDAASVTVETEAGEVVRLISSNIVPFRVV